MNSPKLALVTGASSGLGKALCYALAKQHIPLIIVARNEERLKKLASELPIAVQIVITDLSQKESRKKLISIIKQKCPDLVINNAGFGLYGPVLSHSLSEMQEIVNVNSEALMEISIEAARSLKAAKKKGTIINISSAAAFFSYPTFCVYAASKAFVNHFSEGFDTEMKPYGIRILTVCPGQIGTDFRKRASKNFPQKTNRMTLQADRTAAMILKQVKKGVSISTIDWRYKLLVGLTRFLPRSFLHSLLQLSLKGRY